ncbi:MAG: hypothetical protein WKF30_17120 [Pyrinomonadaceae bacterium]
MKRQLFAIRNFRAGVNLTHFLVAAVASVLVIRLFLQLTNYPQIGGAASTSPTCCGAASSCWAP